MASVIGSLGPSIVAALMVLIGATVSFKSQKQFDRQTEHRNYLRARYVDFVRAAIELAEAAERATVDDHKIGIWENTRSAMSFDS